MNLLYWFGVKSWTSKDCPAIATFSDDTEVSFNYNDSKARMRLMNKVTGAGKVEPVAITKRCPSGSLSSEYQLNDGVLSFTRRLKPLLNEDLRPLHERAAKIRAEKLAEIAEVLSCPRRMLERELKRHDWHFTMSDCGTTYEAGNQHLSLIQQLIDQVEDGGELYLQYLPASLK